MPCTGRDRRRCLRVRCPVPRLVGDEADRQLLDECQAAQAVVDETACPDLAGVPGARRETAVRLRASRHAHHPAYRGEWRP
ncbi:DUF6221 family protein [Streptomyces regalis]|uniref:DUF6221 family protein n=1 Tax=Streptomyces regalis TaxID=68262 RepID=UPI003CC69169